MAPRLLATLAILLLAQYSSFGAEYPLLQQLPDRLHAPVANASDATVGTPKQSLVFQRRYNKLVLQMMLEITQTYHRDRALTRDSVEAYARHLEAAFRFRQRAVHQASPSTPDAELAIANDVHRELLLTIEHMVVAITQGDRSFDWQQWKQRWERAQLSDVP
jgi:hypothetical protein